MRIVFSFILFLITSGLYSQKREHNIRIVNTITSIGDFKMGSDISQYDTIADMESLKISDSLQVCRIKSRRILDGIEIRDVILKFLDKKLVEIDIEYNADLYNRLSYRNGCTYRESSGGYLEIFFYTNTEYVMVAHLYNDTRPRRGRDRMILYALE